MCWFSCTCEILSSYPVTEVLACHLLPEPFILPSPTSYWYKALQPGMCLIPTQVLALNTWLCLTTASALCPSVIYNYLSSAKKRKPAWTDRILWRLRPKALPPDEENENKVGLDAKKLKQLEEDMEYPLKIRQDVYTSMMEYSISDHKPVIGIFTLEVRNWKLWLSRCSQSPFSHLFMTWIIDAGHQLIVLCIYCRRFWRWCKSSSLS